MRQEIRGMHAKSKMLTFNGSVYSVDQIKPINAIEVGNLSRDFLGSSVFVDDVLYSFEFDHEAR